MNSTLVWNSENVVYFSLEFLRLDGKNIKFKVEIWIKFITTWFFMFEKLKFQVQIDFGKLQPCSTRISTYFHALEIKTESTLNWEVYGFSFVAQNKVTKNHVRLTAENSPNLTCYIM